MKKNLTIKNKSKTRRGFLKDISKWIGGTVVLGAAANMFTAGKIKADTTSINSAYPFLASIMLVGFNFAPRGWALCDGQILPIAQNQSLYSLLGTTYGGNGRTDFALPDLRGRVSLHRDGHPLGQRAGAETVTLSEAQIPVHTHSLNVNSYEGNTFNPEGKYLASNSDGIKNYSDVSSSNANGGSIGNSGGGLAHNNMQPYLALNYCIALQGLFPSRN